MKKSKMSSSSESVLTSLLLLPSCCLNTDVMAGAPALILNHEDRDFTLRVMEQKAGKRRYLLSHQLNFGLPSPRLHLLRKSISA